ncbi:MAG TPA: MAPEG family protein [Rhizomicrobium sp.]|jgi:glutathione S-transferase|nr:MAPEG family protein [Rhizomicrobium sp.]
MLALPSILVTAGVTILAVIFYMATAWRVGTMRERHNIAAPAVTGHPEFERAYRVQMNTLEAMPVFLPTLWIAAYYFSRAPLLAPALGLVWIVGRVIYMQAYMADPAKRSLGFTISALATIGLLLLAIAGIVMSWSSTTTI